MASGVLVDPEVKSAYDELKVKKRDSKYLLLSLTPEMDKVIIKKDGKKGIHDFSCFKDDLKEAESKKECKFAVYDYEYTNAQGAKNSKLVYFYWSPDSAKIKEKMVYSATSKKLQTDLGSGIAAFIEAHDWDDLEEISIEEKLVKK